VQKTEWIDDPSQYHGDQQEATSLRERHADLLAQQARLRTRMEAEVWGEPHTEGYPVLVQQRLELFYTQFLPASAEPPNAKRAVAHFGGNLHAINQALKAKYGVDLDDASHEDWSIHKAAAPPPAVNGDEASSRRPGTLCQCIADFVDAPASPFAAMGVKSKDFSHKKLHCSRGGVCEPLGDVGQSLYVHTLHTIHDYIDSHKDTLQAYTHTQILVRICIKTHATLHILTHTNHIYVVFQAPRSIVLHTVLMYAYNVYTDMYVHINTYVIANAGNIYMHTYKHKTYIDIRVHGKFQGKRYTHVHTYILTHGFPEGFKNTSIHHIHRYIHINMTYSIHLQTRQTYLHRWEIPGQTVDGFTEGLKHTSSAVSEAPRMAVDGFENAFRHDPPRPRTEGFV